MPLPSAAGTLPETERRRGILALMILNFFAWGGFFLVVSLVAVRYVDDLGWAAETVGLLLAIRLFTQQSLTTLFRIACDRVGPKPLICTGTSLGLLPNKHRFRAVRDHSTVPRAELPPVSPPLVTEPRATR